LLGTIDRTAKTKKLSDSVKRIQPDGTSKARVWLDDAQFDRVIPWLEELQRRQGINVESAMLEKQDKEGLISARIVFVAAE
jgi:type II secretory pathway component PulM